MASTQKFAGIFTQRSASNAVSSLRSGPNQHITMEKFDLPQNFGELVQQTYNKAFEDGDVVLSESTQEYVEVEDTQFVITLAESLGKKPTHENAPEEIKRPKDFDPFLNPEPNMTVVADYAGQYNIVLNKFPVTPGHILLTTKEFKSQNSPLSPFDLIASMKILGALEKSSKKGEKFFGFYNCGDNSGASQSHKHLQFLRYPDNFTPFPATICSGEDSFIANTNKEPLQNSHLPFAHYALPLPRNESDLYDEDYMALAFSSLLQRTLTILRDAEKPVAYNVLFTRKWLMLVPRSQPMYKDKLGINSAGFTGLLLAKNQELKDFILEEGPLNILGAVGFPNTAGQSTDEYHY